MKNVFKKVLVTLLILSVIVGTVGCKDQEVAIEKSIPKVDYTTGIDYKAEPLSIVQNGVNKYAIVIPKGASTTVDAVAGELNDYVTQVSGAKLAVVNDSVDVNGNFISIGDTAQFKQSGIDISNVKYDGFIIKTIDGNVYIASNKDEGVMFGVYSFLERFMGIRWLTESVTHVPESSDINVYPCDITEEPVFERRVWYDSGSYFTDFYDHRRYYEALGSWYYPGIETPHNSTDYDDSRKSCGYVNKYDVVSKETGEFLRKYTAEIDEETEMYLKDRHPEYFTDESGTDIYGNPKPATPSSGGYDICFTNGVDEQGNLIEGKESAVKYIIDKVKRALAEDATAMKYKYFQIAEMDNGGAICKCDTCLSRRNAYKGGGVVTMFINCIEREVNSWLKETQNGRTVTFSTFAYHTSVNPPVKKVSGKYVPLADFCIANENVQIRVAPIGADYTYSFQDPNQIATFKELFAGWSVCAEEIRVWDYVIDFYARTWWYPNLHYMKENFIFYHNMGVIEIFNECSRGSAEVSFWTNALKSYVVSKLYWDLGWDVSELVDEFMELYYGKAAPAAKQFLNIIDGHYAEYRATKGSLDMMVVSPACNFYKAEKYPLNLMTGMMSIMDNAIQEITEDATLTESEKSQTINRLKAMKVTPMAMILKNYATYYNPETERDFAKEMLSICDEVGVKSLGSGQSVDDLKKKYDIG